MFPDIFVRQIADMLKLWHPAQAVFSSQEDRGDLASAVMNVVERFADQFQVPGWYIYIYISHMLKVWHGIYIYIIRHRATKTGRFLWHIREMLVNSQKHHASPPWCEWIFRIAPIHRRSILAIWPYLNRECWEQPWYRLAYFIVYKLLLASGYD